MAIVGALALSACASPEFPQSGTPTPYDGKWVLNMTPLENPSCEGIHGQFEVRYGYAIGLVEWRSENYDIWGEIDDTGKLDGLIGQLGVRGATAKVHFTASSAEGTWESKGCGKGTLTAEKAVG